MENTNNNPLYNKHYKDTKKEDAIKLFNALIKEPLSRRMAATLIGYPDQTYMVTQLIFDWIAQGKAQVIGTIKCNRSGRFVQKITTNKELFISISISQLHLSDQW
jgi:hypothetical protein